MTQPVTAPATTPVANSMAAAMPANAADPLQNLRDIQMPMQPHWWPPAPGWWILLAIILLGIGVVAFLHWQRKHWQQKILDEVENAVRQHADNRQQQITGLSEILRRVALRAFSREQVANLYGIKWLEFLDEHAAKTGSFMQHDMRVLADETYRPPGDAKPLNFDDPLVNAVRIWIRRNLS